MNRLLCRILLAALLIAAAAAAFYFGYWRGTPNYAAGEIRQAVVNKDYQLFQERVDLRRVYGYALDDIAAEIAETIKPQFQETDTEKIKIIVERYKEQDTWKGNTVFEKESFELLENILEEAGELDTRVPYEDLVKTEFAKAASATTPSSISHNP